MVSDLCDLRFEISKLQSLNSMPLALKGINVNAIAPGYMRTDNTSALPRDEMRSRQRLDRIPAERRGDRQDKFTRET